MARFRFQTCFLLLALLIPGLTRVWLWATRLGELTDLGLTGTLEMFWTGLRLDGVVTGTFTLPTCLALLLVPKIWLRGTLVLCRVWAALVFLVFVGSELSGLQFFSFYDFRPNYLVLDHGADAEVMNTILAAYPVFGVGLATLLIGLVFTWVLCRVTPLPAARTGSGWRDRLMMIVMFLFTALIVRGTVDHRPLNPSASAFSSNRLANEVAGSGMFNVIYEYLQRQGDRYGELSEFIETLPDDQALAAARAHLAPTGIFVDDGPNPLVRIVGNEADGGGPTNVVFIVLESYTGRLIGHLGGELSLSPELDELAGGGLALTRLYATGERTVQGLEASLCSFPPQPGTAAVRRPEGRTGFDTLATVLRRAGYATTFVYGGQGIFDHMRAFFLGNGYEQFIEEDDFTDALFVGSWGASDDDMYDRVIREAREHHDAGEPFLVTALTVSLHSPWEYPPGVIEDLPRSIEVPDGFEYEELNTFLYADSAIGRFMDAARAEPWFDDTLFVFVGDHGVHLRGRLTVPVEEYRVPGVFYAPKHIPPERFEAVSTQLDLTPTVLGLLGGEFRSTFFGRDLLASRAGGAAPAAAGGGAAPVGEDGLALMVYRKERFAVVSDQRFTLLAKEGDDETRAWIDGDWQVCEPTPGHAADALSARGVLQMAETLLSTASYRAEDDAPGR